jgi:hypothetical protein
MASTELALKRRVLVTQDPNLELLVEVRPPRTAP